MNETNFDWDDIRLFLAVARSGGLAGASNITGKSAPTLGRRMLALENQLGQDLFVRFARGYTLTENGERLLETAEQLDQSITPLICTAKQSARRVKISAGSWVSHYLSQHMHALLAQDAPTVQFIAADHVLDIGHREAVIGIRNQRPTQVSLAGRRIRKIRFAVYGKSSKVTAWVQVAGSTPSSRWVRENAKYTPRIEVTQPRNALDMALAGSVRTVLPTFIGDSTEGIVRLSKPIEALEHTQWLVTHHEERHVPEVRRIIDWVYGVLKEPS